uniref:Uncharacterized protein n=1 Tax=Acanthochromis polyacanthus TaxID=80966 RepID=A0A3Q1GL05_9TELE
MTFLESFWIFFSDFCAVLSWIKAFLRCFCSRMDLCQEDCRFCWCLSVTRPSVCGLSVTRPSVCGPSVARPSVCGPSVARPSVCGPSVAHPSVCGPSVARPSVCGRSVARPSVCGPSVPSFRLRSVCSRPSVCGRSVARPSVCDMYYILCYRPTCQPLSARQKTARNIDKRTKHRLIYYFIALSLI